MRTYKKEFILCYIIYVAIFIALALYPYSTIGPNGKTYIFDTLYRSNLYIPFTANTIIVLYYMFKIAFGNKSK